MANMAYLYLNWTHNQPLQISHHGEVSCAHDPLNQATTQDLAKCLEVPGRALEF